jgi:spore maturation protein CgeB
MISLNFANAPGDNQLKARTFEVPGAGGFLLSERVQGLEGVYAVDQEIAVFDNDLDLIEKVRYFFNHPDDRDAIAKAGFERTRRDHTYEIRLSELLPFALEAKAKSARLPPRLLPESFEECVQQHRFGITQRTLGRVLVTVCSAIWGRELGPRAARNLLWRFSWRFLRTHTFRARGWPGRVFPNLS